MHFSQNFFFQQRQHFPCKEIRIKMDGLKYLPEANQKAELCPEKCFVCSYQSCFPSHQRVSATVREISLVSDLSRRSTDHLSLSFSSRFSSSTVNTCNEWLGGRFKLLQLTLDNNCGKRARMTTTAASSTIAEQIEAAFMSTDDCSFSLTPTQKNARLRPLSSSAPQLLCFLCNRSTTLLAISHSLLPYRQLQLQLQDRGVSCQL